MSKVQMPKLTVGELRKALEGQPDDAAVSVLMDDGCCGDFTDLEAYDCDSSLKSSYKPEPGYVSIRVTAAPGFRTCIQSGGTKRSDEMYFRRNKTFVEKTLAGQQVNIADEIKEHEQLQKEYKTCLIIWDWLGFTPDQWHSYNDGTRTVTQILRDIKEKSDDKQILDSVVRKWGMFRLRLRNALARGGWASNPGATDDDICKAVEDLADRKILDATPLQKLKLEYLRKEAKDYRSMHKSQAIEAAKEGDHEKWDLSRIALGQAFAFEQMIGYTKGFNSKQQGLAKRKGKL